MCALKAIIFLRKNSRQLCRNKERRSHIMQTYTGIEDCNVCSAEINNKIPRLRRRREISWKNIIQTACV
jgi:hypothetical protein